MLGFCNGTVFGFKLLLDPLSAGVVLWAELIVWFEKRGLDCWVNGGEWAGVGGWVESQGLFCT